MGKELKIPVPLPEGWTSSRLLVNVDDFVVLSMSPGGGHVTVDMLRRSFALGMAGVHKAHSAKVYAGRGWKLALFNDAIAALQKVYA